MTHLNGNLRKECIGCNKPDHVCIAICNTQPPRRKRPLNEEIISALSRALWDSDLVASRLTLATAEFFWAVMLLWPGDTFGRPTYDHIARVANEEVWGIVFLISAMLQATIVLQEDFHSKFARYFATFNTVLWVYTVVSMLLSVYPPPAAIGGEISLAFAAIWIWARPYLLVEGYKRAGIS